MNNEKLISPLREPVSPPVSIVDETGQAAFGTFKSEIVNLNLMDCYRPTGKKISKIIQDLKLTRWEATEIVTKRHSIVTAVYGMGKLGFGIIVLWDREKNEIKSFIKFGNSKSLSICPNLIDTKTSLESKKVCICTENNLDKGYARTKGRGSSSKKGDVAFDVKLTRLSPPSVVSIPFGKNMPLYSQKDFLKADGYIEVNGERFDTNEESVAIIDDHKGYYPRRAHYDWLTTMGMTVHNGKKIYIALNLTKNQSIDEYNYNENLIWIEDKSFPLPPIKFDKDEKEWHVYDDKGLVDIHFKIQNRFDIVANLGAFNVKYYLPVGTLEGFVVDSYNNKYSLSNMIGIAEDKSTLL